MGLLRIVQLVVALIVAVATVLLIYFLGVGVIDLFRAAWNATPWPLLLSAAALLGSIYSPFGKWVNLLLFFIVLGGIFIWIGTSSGKMGDVQKGLQAGKSLLPDPPKGVTSHLKNLDTASQQKAAETAGDLDREGVKIASQNAQKMVFWVLETPIYQACFSDSCSNELQGYFPKGRQMLEVHVLENDPVTGTPIKETQNGLPMALVSLPNKASGKFPGTEQGYVMRKMLQTKEQAKAALVAPVETGPKSQLVTFTKVPKSSSATVSYYKVEGYFLKGGDTIVFPKPMNATGVIVGNTPHPGTINKGARFTFQGGEQAVTILCTSAPEILKLEVVTQ